jgi:hypothetical protein
MKRSHVYKSIFILLLLVSIPIIMSARHVISKGTKDLRCGGQIIRKGESQLSVSNKIKKCGVVLSKEVMTSGSGNIKSVNWVVKIKNRCYLILFVNGVLRDIGQDESCR